MSNEISRGNPASRATACAPTTPAAGPDSTVRTASARARDEEIEPPFDCMIDSRFVPAFAGASARLRRPVFAAAPARRPSSRSSRPRYRSISGDTYAFTAVVLQRSNSRYSGSTSDDTDTSQPSRRRRSATSPLVGGIHVRMQQADRRHFGALSAQAIREGSRARPHRAVRSRRRTRRAARPRRRSGPLRRSAAAAAGRSCTARIASAGRCATRPRTRPWR